MEGATRKSTIDSEGSFIIIGERINRSSRKLLTKSLAKGNMSLVREEALAQVEAGVQIIDINVTAVDVDEETIAPLAVQTMAEAIDEAICIDTVNH